MVSREAFLASVFAGAVLLGCGSATGDDCAGEGVYAVKVEIVDSLTGAPLAYRSSLIIRDGAYVDSVPFRWAAVDSARVNYLDAGPDREGTYNVTVRRAGSQVWTRNGVRARRENGCNVKQAQLRARLQPTN